MGEKGFFASVFGVLGITDNKPKNKKYKKKPVPKDADLYKD